MPWPYAIVACSIGRQVFAGRRRPATSPGNPVLRRRAEARVGEHLPHASRGGSDSAIFAAPTFDDFWITCSTVSVPSRMRVVDRARRRSSACRALVCDQRVGRDACRPRAPRRSVNGFSVEPGSNTSVSARLRIRSRATCRARFGLYVGQLASARISPLRASTIDERRPPSPCAARPPPSARETRGTAGASRSRARDRGPACGARIAATSSTTSPRRLMITRRLPGSPPSQSCCASSMPSWPGVAGRR